MFSKTALAMGALLMATGVSIAQQPAASRDVRSGTIARAELPERISLEIKRVRTLQVRTLRSFRCSRGAGANPGRNRSPFPNAALCLFLGLLHFALRVVDCFRQLKKLFDEPVGSFGPETVADK